MERWSRGWQQIGGPNALTKWSWILTLPLALVISNVYAQTPTPTQVVVWLGIALLVHCILGVLMWLAWVTMLSNRPRRSRPITAIIVFAALGTARGWLMQSAQDVTGIGGTDFLERMGINVLGSIVVLAAIAVVVDDFRTDADIRARLEEANQTLATVRDQEEAALRAADKDVLDRVQAAVETALSESGATSERCRQISEEIVRPISHELAEARFAPALTLNPPTSTKLTFREAFAATAAPSPLAVALLFQISAFGAVLGRFGLTVALANLILGGAALYLGGCAFRRFIPLPQALIPRVVIIALGFAAIGGISTLVVPTLISRFIAPFDAQLLGPAVGAAAAALIVTFGTAIINGRRQRLDAMAEAVAESAASIELLNARVEERRTQASRFLHGPIQSELIAAAVRGDSPATARSIVKHRFKAYGTQAPTKLAHEQFEDLLRTWEAVLTIERAIDESVWHQLDSTVSSVPLLLDALSEGLTNVLRHSLSSIALLSLQQTQVGVRLTVTSEGSLNTKDQTGIGLANLRDRGVNIRLEASSGRVSMTAEIEF